MEGMSLYQEIAASIGFADSKMVPEMLAMVADQDEAKLVLAASPPATVAELAGKTGFSTDKIEAMLAELYRKGLIFKSKKPDATRYYKLRKFIQFHDGTVLTPGGVSQDYLDMWKKFEATELHDLQQRIKHLDFRQGMRVLPVNVSLNAQTQILAFEDVNKVVENARRIAVTNCSCRTIHGYTKVPMEVCMQLDKAADYAVERGTGRELTKLEAIEMLRMCEEEGLVHCVDNERGRMGMICNCDKEICGNWGHDREHVKKFCAPSRFRATVATDLCTSCGICVKRCFFDAVTMDGVDNCAVVSHDKCMGCGLCLPTCPADAITYAEVSTVDSVPE